MADTLVSLSKTFLDAGISPDKVQPELAMLMRKRAQLNESGIDARAVEQAMNQYAASPEFQRVLNRPRPPIW